MPQLLAAQREALRGSPARQEGNCIAFLCTNNMSLLSLSLCTEALRIANRVTGEAAFGWRLVTEDGTAVVTSGGMRLVPDSSIAEADDISICIVLASYEPEAACTPTVLAWLRRLGREGVSLGCVDTGAFILGRAGLVEKGRVAVHHESLAPFEERWANIGAPDQPFIVDPKRLSSGGGIDTLDMMLVVIARFLGEETADHVSAIMRYERHREASDFTWPIGHLGVRALSEDLHQCIDLMRQSVEEPLPLSAVCARLGLSEWKLRQFFRRYLKTTPSQYYLRIRLEKAHQLLRWSDLPVSEIAAACGFADCSSFTHAYKRVRRITPSADRQSG